MLASLFCLALASCGAAGPTPAPPTLFSRGEAIPLGETTLKVYKAELTSEFLPAYTGLGTQKGMTNAVVSFTFQTPQLKSQQTVKEKIQLIYPLSLTLVTDAGKKYTSHLILPGDQFRKIRASQTKDPEAIKPYLSDSGTVPDDFVVIFVIPEGPRELTLYVCNPSAKEGQARLAAVGVW